MKVESIDVSRLDVVAAVPDLPRDLHVFVDYVHGREVKRWPVTAPAGAVERFHEKLEVQTPTDGYVVVRVDGDKPLTPVVGDGKTFAAYPFALTNPVFLDVDGDGKYRTGAKHNH